MKNYYSENILLDIVITLLTKNKKEKKGHQTAWYDSFCCTNNLHSIENILKNFINKYVNKCMFLFCKIATNQIAQ